MKLSIETSLHGIARALDERIAPALSDPFAAEAARLARMLLSIAANGVDDAAAVRVAENAAIRTLLGELAPLIDGKAADEAAAAAIPAPAGDLRLSALDRENGQLRALLVAAHAAVEILAGAAARDMDRRVWRLLADVEAARAPRS